MSRSVGVAILLAAATAAAHGLPPMTNGVSFASDDPNSVYVASTFGLLVSHDAGCTFYWVCEAKIGYRDPYQPRYAVSHDGAIFATSYMGLRVSRDGGCSFTTAAAATQFVDVVAIAPNHDVWIGTNDAGPDNDLFVSTDNGVTFTPMGMSPAMRWTSLVAPTAGDPKRLYAIGQDGQTVHLMRHDLAWTEVPMTGVQVATSPLVSVAAVDPTNHDVVYVISELGSGDHLYRSIDGGTTFAEVFAPTEGFIKDVVVRDAHATFVTTLVPAGSVAVGGPAYVSTDGGAFAAIAGAPGLQCLGVAPDGSLIGCGHNWDPDFMAVTRSVDGAAWTKVWRFVELAGGLACPAETDVGCEQTATDVMTNFASTGPVCGDHEFPPDAGVDVTMAEPPPPPGCCDAGDPPSLVWAIGVAGFLWRRRRRYT